MGVRDAVQAAPLVDHHCHGVLVADPEDARFDALLTEGGPAPGQTNFDTPVGLSVRRHCAPLLDLEPHTPPQEYLRRRRELGAAEVNRRFLGSTRSDVLAVDTGFDPEGLTSPAELAALAGLDPARGRVVVRLEQVAEDVARGGVEEGDLGTEFAAALERATRDQDAVGVKSIAAYRCGLDLDPRRPAPAQVERAAARWLARDRGSGAWRLDDQVLVRHLLWTAVDLGLPIQFHIGFGDSDIRMSEVDPTLLTDWLHSHRVPVMLLHCWPWHRHASYLACIYPHVHLDVGSVLHYVGPRRSVEVLAEAAEVTPFTRLLYSSDAYGAPELYVLGALNYRLALDALLRDRVDAGEWAAADAERFAHLVSHGNAEHVYRLPAQ